jgi:hypothetical protein
MPVMDPKRLEEEAGLSPDLRRALEAERIGCKGPRSDLSALRASVLTASSHASAAWLGVPGLGGKSSTTLLLTKTMASVAVAVGLSYGVHSAIVSRSSPAHIGPKKTREVFVPEPAVLSNQESAAPPTETPPPATPQPDVKSPLRVRKAQPVARHESVPPPAEEALEPSGTIEEQLRIFERAKSEIALHHNRAAIEELEGYLDRYPEGALRMEAAQLLVEAHRAEEQPASSSHPVIPGGP